MSFTYTTLSHETIENPSWNYVQVFRRVKIDYSPLHQDTSLSSICETMENVFFTIISESLPVIREEDQIRLCIDNALLDRPIWVSFRKGVNFTESLVTNALFKIAQSKRDFLLQGEIHLDIVWIKMPSGGGNRSNFPILDVKKFARKSKAVITIEGDGLCCARSICVGKALADKVDGRTWRRICEDTFKIQTKQAKELCKLANVPINVNCGIEELIKFHGVLTGYRLVVLQGNTGKFLYKEGDDNLPTIQLLYANNHYDTMKSFRSFFGYSYYCEKCLVGFNHKLSHKCEYSCKLCLASPQCLFVEKTFCHSCKKNFFSAKCYANHKEKGICKTWKTCESCLKTFTQNHECGKHYCSTCKKLVLSANHLCFIAPSRLETHIEERMRSKIFVFYDIESFINDKGNHQPNLIVSSHCCDNCWVKFQVKDCSVCDAKINTFFGEDAIGKFCVWLFKIFASDLKTKYTKLKKTIPKIYVIAHNGRAYDFHFVLKYIHDFNIACVSDIIKNGSKIISMVYGNYKFLDSLSFLPMPLKSLPKAFDLPLIKGWFPHKFNLPTNWNYIGVHPEIEYYEPDLMNTRDRSLFCDWYEKVKHTVFNFNQEIHRYCNMDVQILRDAFMLFRTNFIQQTSIDPIIRSITIAQACMEVFKTSFLNENTLAVIPSKGYEPTRKTSFIATMWLAFQAEKSAVQILREYRIDKYFADGFCAETNTIYEFFGCFFHGCLKCYPHKRTICKSPYQNVSMEEIYNKTQEKLSYYRKKGFNLITTWECEFNEKVRADNHLKEFCEKYRLLGTAKKPPLDPRDAFFGGRTNAIKLFHQISSNEKIFYYDFTSLYPYVVKYCAYPKGHPKIIKKDFNKDITVYNGFVYCAVQPPTQLYFPVLPVRINGKLLFPLCRVCAKTMNQGVCYHNDDERKLIGSWTTPELKKALSLGYNLLEVYEVWHFEEMLEYNPKNDKHGLFGSFIDKWIKLKTEASGWPKHCFTEEAKTHYIEEFKKREGIVLDRDRIASNPPLRTQAKLCANSFWGKFAQRPNLRKCSYLKQPKEFFKMLTNPELEILDAFLINPETLMVQYEKTEGFIQDPKHSNIAVAAFTTAYARLKLYELLEKLERSVLYFDTDSIIYVSDGTEEKIETGSFLGDLTDELEDFGEGSYIEKFVSGGPKNYAFQVRIPGQADPQYVCKVKGISLNFKAAEAIKFDTMEQIIKDSINNNAVITTPVEQLIFKLDRDNTVSTHIGLKKYRMVYDKRRILPNSYLTLPYGYKESL